MKKCFLLIISILIIGVTQAQERIISYNTHILIEDSGNLRVTEEITVQAEGTNIRRGIFRTFPTLYKDKMGTRFKVDFEVSEVLKNGNPEPWFTENRSNGVVVYIGDKNYELSPGIYTYSIKYLTTRQIGFFKEFDELYFNAIGGDWAFPIEKATVAVDLPAGASVVQKAAYSGIEGSVSCDCQVSVRDSRLLVETNQTLWPGEQLTFAVAWPKGFIKEPSSAAKVSTFFKDNFHVLFGLIGLALVFFLYFREWKKVGKDPIKGTIIPLFDPPAGFTPAGTAYLDKLGMTDRVFTAALVNMAVKGYLKIIQIKRKYTLEKTSDDTSLLSPEEVAMATALFAGRQSLELDNKNHTVFQSAKNKTDRKLSDLLTPKYFKRNTHYMTKGFVLAIIWAVITFLISPGVAVPIILSVLLLALSILFVWLMKAPTPEGRAVMDEIEGFKMYVDVAEQQQLDALHEPRMTIERFEKLLPFAIALGVENKWGKKFEQALARSMQEAQSYRPAWYAGAGAMAFSPARFTSDVGRSFSSAISSASTPPGSKSGSGGGGSSGGGGGGGGGGGW